MSMYISELESPDGFARMMQNLYDYAHVTDKQVAKLMSVSERTARRWREGETQPSPSELIKLFRLLHAPIRAFINDEENYSDQEDRECVDHYLKHYATKSEMRDMRFNLTFKHGSSVSAQLSLVSMLNHMKLGYRLMAAKTVIMLWEIAETSGGLQYIDCYMPDVKKVRNAIVKTSLALQEGKDSYTDI